MRAVEQHLMEFIRKHRVPQKYDCLQCLDAEPRALRARSWKAVKDYVRNRITTLRRQSGSGVRPAGKEGLNRRRRGLKTTSHLSVVSFFLLQGNPRERKPERRPPSRRLTGHQQPPPERIPQVVVQTGSNGITV